MDNKNMVESLTRLENRWKAEQEFLKFRDRLKSGEVRYDGTDPVLSCIDQYISNNNAGISILKQNTTLYRARNIDIDDYCKLYYDKSTCYLNGYDETNSREPPLGISPSGRNNIMGISYLYLSDNRQTACCEVKPIIKGLISLAEFEVVEPLRIIDFTKNNTDITSEIRLIYLYSFISRSYTVPVIDEKIDYYTTQVLTDYIRKKGYDGICYKSFFDNTGKNYTIFNSDRKGIKFIKSSVLQFKSLHQVFYDFNDMEYYEANSLGGDSTNEDNALIKQRVIKHIDETKMI